MAHKTVELVTNTETKEVLYSPALQTELPGLDAAFEQVDTAFNERRGEFLQRLEDAQFTVKTSEGPEVACSLLMNQGRQSDELMIIFAPFADPAPKSSAETMLRYIHEDKTISKGQAQPNTWSQTTKSAVTTDLLSALGHGMPVLTIYAPIPSAAYARDERKQMRTGDFSAAGRVAQEVLQQAVSSSQSRVHGGDGQQRFSKLHISGASLGASNALGAAVRLMHEDFEIASVTMQELVMSPKHLLDLAKRFTVGGISGEASARPFPDEVRKIAEPLLRRLIDRSGSELIGMNARMLQGASKYSYMKGLTKVVPTIDYLSALNERGTSVLVATADNSAMSDKTRLYVPSEIAQAHIAAQQGEKLGHIVDEYVAVSSIVTALNVTRARRGRNV